jgi:hypothetical protein
VGNISHVDSPIKINHKPDMWEKKDEGRPPGKLGQNDPVISTAEKIAQLFPDPSRDCHACLKNDQL